MIQQAFINEWRKAAPWQTEAQIEQDLILSRAIIEIFSEPLLAKSLAFRGGTALHKLFIQPPGRYSEDIDLVQIDGGKIGPIMEALRKQLNPWLGEPRWKLKEGRATFIYRFDSESFPITPMRLKVEINTREHFSVLGLAPKTFAVNSQWFTSDIVITTFVLEELLGTKLRALYQRKKGRDLFDLSIALKQFSSLDASKIVQCFHHYLAFDKAKVTRAEFAANLAAKLDDVAFTGDIIPLLPYSINTTYDPLDAVDRVLEKIISLLPGNEWKGDCGSNS
jgi:predicted nucleotidyltransferase component of viral defense system